ncbi:hypothetical protein ATANTOWER_001310 [Ataeniobius toweri]|uniref:Secreted protein n=1 Tax=Ataeniobius toweri TaxID=208326 RepID=A0ABU7A3P9_9TELE|nr:hypothetical protein [Ataeniobius toweri]
MHMCNCSMFQYFVFATFCSLTRSLTAKFTTGVLVQELINNTLPLPGFKHDDLRWKGSLSLECHRVSSACFNRETGRVTKRHRSGRPLATSHTDDGFIVNSALRNQMINGTQLQAHLTEVRGIQVTSKGT